VKARTLWALFVLWPLILWLAAFAVGLSAHWYGCEISARGSSPCVVLGRDIGEQLYPLWAMGYFFGFALLWMIPAALLWWIVEIFKARR